MLCQLKLCCFSFPRSNLSLLTFPWKLYLLPSSMSSLEWQKQQANPQLQPHRCGMARRVWVCMSVPAHHYHLYLCEWGCRSCGSHHWGFEQINSGFSWIVEGRTANIVQANNFIFLVLTLLTSHPRGYSENLNKIYWIDLVSVGNVSNYWWNEIVSGFGHQNALYFLFMIKFHYCPQYY